jgi:hypothetical protein
MINFQKIFPVSVVGFATPAAVPEVFFWLEGVGGYFLWFKSL